MRVLIESTSSAAILQLAGASPESYIYTDERSAPAEEIPAYARNPEMLQTEWYGRGTNHRTEDGHAKREVTHDGWFVRVQSLEQIHTLLALSGAKLGVVSSPEPIFSLDTD